ncbi:TMEM175 family protein [Terricaulis sp.]|uniref:TMEM175 family protein n=1 Tax=Terricaulis sp. TaxID=2768686 RepID=UPI0037849862
MEKDRLLAFSDGVIAIIITIMVLELRPPHEPTLHALSGLAPTFLSYVLSFVYIAIYWNNHHHMLYVTKGVNGAILWANMALLFCLSLVPFTTAWMGDTAGATLPTAIYGVSLILPAFAFLILQTLIVRADGPDSVLARAIGGDWKGKLSPVLYALGIVLAFVQPMLSWLLYVAVAVIWLVPDKRIERVVTG